MDANEYQKAALRTANQADEQHPYGLLLNGVMGLCGESGECIDRVKKFMFQGHDLNVRKLAEEIGDCLWYSAITAQAIGYTLGDIMRMNIDKLTKRYPDGFSADRSINREEYKHDQN